MLYTVAQRPATAEGTDSGEWLDATAYDGVEAHLVDSLELPVLWPHPVLVNGATVYLGRPAAGTNSASQLEAWTLPDTGRFAKLAETILSQPAQSIAAFEGLIAVVSYQDYQDVQLFDATNPSVLNQVGGGGPSGCVGFNLENADGLVRRGLWLPLGGFGVHHVGLPVPPSTP